MAGYTMWARCECGGRYHADGDAFRCAECGAVITRESLRGNGLVPVLGSRGLLYVTREK